jgi:hypothetical protein
VRVAAPAGRHSYSAQDDPGERAKADVVISLEDTPKAVAAAVMAGTFIDLVLEETWGGTARTVFHHLRVVSVTEDRRKKGGHTATVRMTPAQAKAFEVLKEAAKVIVEHHKPAKK